MNKWIHDVLDFNIKNGYNPPLVPGKIKPEIKALRLRLMMEELGELACAIHSDDLVEVADGITDLIYVAIGTAIDCGLHEILDDCWEEVQRANMSKDPAPAGDGRKGGIKGPGYTLPDIKKLVTDYIRKCDDDIPF